MTIEENLSEWEAEAKQPRSMTVSLKREREKIITLCAALRSALECIEKKDKEIKKSYRRSRLHYPTFGVSVDIKEALDLKPNLEGLVE